MKITPEFPNYRRDDPKRQAERRVYEELASSNFPGQALYEVSATKYTPQVDFVVWVEDVACFAIQVKGGHYRVENGTLFRREPDGTKQVGNLLSKALDGALSVRNAITDSLKRNSFVISVLLFPDMDPDTQIEEWSDASRTKVLFGVDHLMERLAQLDEVQTVHRPPSAQCIEQEVVVFTQEQVPEANQVPVPPELPTALHAQHVEIHNLTINLFAPLPMGASFRQQPDASGESMADAESKAG